AMGSGRGVRGSGLGAVSVPDKRVGGRKGDDAAKARFEAIHLSPLAGLPTQVGHKDEHGVFCGTRQRKFRVFPGSALAKKPPEWVLAAQVLDIGGKVWGMQCARMQPAWIERQAAHLLRRTWSE